MRIGRGPYSRFSDKRRGKAIFMSARELRIAENESMFRAVNEGIGHARERLPDSTIDFVCECGDDDCEERLPITNAQYEHVRLSPIQFVVKPGHELEDTELVVDRHDGFVVVEKEPGEAADLAVAEDPRS